MYNIKARVWLAVLFATVVLCSWCMSGFNFNERGDDAAYCFFTTVVAFVCGITCPIFD